MMNYTTVENPSWTKDKSGINCVVNFTAIGAVPFTASPNDLPHSIEIYNRCVAGEFGPIAEYVFHIDEGENPQSTGPAPSFGGLPQSVL